MSGNFESRIIPAIQSNNDHLIADLVLEKFKEALLTENVMQTLFGASGERIFIDKPPNINETITPYLEIYPQSESFSSNYAYYDGVLNATLALPTMFAGHIQTLRRIGAIFQRFMGSIKFNIFDPVVPGLTQFGYNSQYTYDQLIPIGEPGLPCILITIPFRIDMDLMRNSDPSYDFGFELDAGDIGFIESLTLALQAQDDTHTTLADTGVTVVTGQTN